MLQNNKTYLLSILMMLSIVTAWAQPCLTGWTYRVPIAIDNSGGASSLTDYQFELVINSQQLIADGKAQLSGGDLRVLAADGTVLPIWVDHTTYNSTASSIWFKGSVAASTRDTVYLFYGKPDATTLSNGDDVFELFDDFLGASIDASKWDVCNESNTTVAGGEISISSTAASNDRTLLTSVNSFSTPVRVESFINEVTDGISILGLKDNSDQGYAMVYEDNTQPTVRLLRLEPDADCYTVDDVHPSQNASRSANQITGVWGFTWYSTNTQEYYWEGNGGSEIRNDVDNSLPSAAFVSFGNLNKIGNIKADYLRVRKYTSSTPVLSLGTEVSSIVSVSVDDVDELCEGETLDLTASAVAGAVYSWTGPNGFTSSDQNPSLTNVSLVNAGQYNVTATLAGGCSTAEDSVVVAISATTVAGTIAGQNVVCSGTNADSVFITGETGNVARWETSQTGLAPWVTINHTATTLEYTNILQTTYYRGVVKSGVCAEEITDSVVITVDDNTIAGGVIGSTEVCSDVNSGTLELTTYLGTISNWQLQEEGTGLWVDVPGTNKLLDFTNLTTTTYYRARLQNGVCLEQFSDSATVTVNPLPVAAFSAEAVCLGNNSQFVDESTVSTGTIKNYLWNFDDGKSELIANPSHEYVGFGSYDVNLRVETDKGCFDEVENDVIVNPLPQVDFFYTNVCLRNEMTFTQNTSVATGSIVDFTWDFGDFAGTSKLPTDSYLYSVDANYEVELVAESNEGCKDSITHIVTVYPRATLAFDVDDVFLGQTSSFANNSTISEGNLTYDWNFGDSKVSNLPNPTHAYEAAGTYDVTLISTSTNGGCKDTIVQQTTINDQTKADFSVSDECAYDSARFVNESFIAVGSMTYEWDFGDGASSTDESPVHLYASAGTYLVTLKATSDLGSESTESKTVTIYPIPKSSFITENVCDEVATGFSNLSTLTSGNLSYAWEFGDGNASTDFQPTHTYATDGTYTVQMVAASDFGCTDTSMNDVVIHPLPQTGYSNDVVCFGSPTNFTDTTSISLGSITNYSWDFGDGTNSIVQNPVKQFGEKGFYLVTLKTTSDQGCVFTISKTVEVLEVPVASFSVGDVCYKEAIIPSNTSFVSAGVLTYQWLLGDGDTSITKNPTHIYAVSGTYDIDLKVTTQFGCSDSTTGSVEIYALPSIEAGEDLEVSQGYSVELSATGGTDYIWEPSASLDDQGVANPTATPFSTTTYTVSVTDINGCKGSDEQTVTVNEDFNLVPSNVVTPDGNAENDTWYIGNIETFPSAEIIVFDRWGKIVFEQTAYQNDWEAVSGTDILPDGEYYYVIRSTDFDKVYKGTVSVIRGNQ